MGNICKNYIAGKWTAPNSVKPLKMFNPADLNEQISEVIFADERLADFSIEHAEKAFFNWKETPIEERIKLVEKFLEGLITNRYKIAEIITKENGKTLSESYGEINSTLREANYQIKFLRDSTIETVGNSQILYEPLGVVLLITPWNFPIATILRKLIPALLVGNTIVVKPSELTPLSSVALFQVLGEAGFPEGVVNLVMGGSDIGSVMSRHQSVKAISLTGSTLTGYSVLEQTRGNNVRFQAEMGGKNTVVVLKDADIDKAAKDIVNNSFACCGQWCTGTSKVIVDENIQNELLEKLSELTSKIVLGNGLDELTTMGPLISKAQLTKTMHAVTQAENEKAKLIIGGKRPAESKLTNGYFFEPTIYSNVYPNMFISYEEIFGPILAVLKTKNLEEALELTNQSKYGLAFSIYTKNSETAEKFIQNVNAGVCHINLPTSFRDPALPLLGWKNSGYGIPESGRFARDFFTRTKAIYKA